MHTWAACNQQKTFLYFLWALIRWNIWTFHLMSCCSATNGGDMCCKTIFSCCNTKSLWTCQTHSTHKLLLFIMLLAPGAFPCFILFFPEMGPNPTSCLSWWWTTLFASCIAHFGNNTQLSSISDDSGVLESAPEMLLTMGWPPRDCSSCGIGL